MEALVSATVCLMSPYRANAHRLDVRIKTPWLRRFVLLGIGAALSCALIVLVAHVIRNAPTTAREIAANNCRLDAQRIRSEVLSWRRSNPGRCPSLIDIGEPSTAMDVWHTGYMIQCEPEVIVRSAGPDRVYFSADDIVAR